MSYCQSCADLQAQLREREREHKDQLAALRMTWEAKDRDLIAARMTLAAGQTVLDNQAALIERLRVSSADAEREAERLREALEKYARHASWCSAWCEGGEDDDSWHGPHEVIGGVCSCGLRAALTPPRVTP